MRPNTSIFISLLSVFMLGSLALAQGIPKGGGTSTITRPGSIEDTNPMEYWSGMESQGRAGGVLLGKVNVAGEGFLWEPVPVIVSCNGMTEYTTQSDVKGDFLIRPLKISGELSLQGDMKRQMETHYEGCIVQASLTGFESTAITITHRNLRDDPELGIITLRRSERAEGTALSGSRESIPANALKAFDKARAELMDQKPDRARGDLEKAVQLDPQFAEAWYQLGRLQLLSNNPNARESFEKAATADPSFVLPYEQLAAIAASEEKWADVLNNTSHVIKLDPSGTPQVWYFDAMANVRLGRIAAAKSSAVKSLAMDPLHQVPNTEQLLGVILTFNKDYAGALGHYRNCLSYMAPGSNADLIKKQIAQLEHLTANRK